MSIMYLESIWSLSKVHLEFTWSIYELVDLYLIYFVDM